MDIDITSSLSENYVLSVKKSFPNVESLRLRSSRNMWDLPVVIPSDFLGCSTPRLRDLHLDGTNFPALPRFLSSAKSLVSIQLKNISSQGIFRADELAASLSVVTQLESLKIAFHSAVSISRLPRLNGVSPLATRTNLPALLELEYSGDSTFLDFAFMTDAPIIEKIGISFSRRPQNEIYDLFGFFGRGEELRLSHPRMTYIQISKNMGVVFTHHFSRLRTSSGRFQVKLPWNIQSDTYVPLLAQTFSSSTSHGTLRKVTQLYLEGDVELRSQQSETETWLGLFRVLTGVKRLQVSGTPVSRVVSTLGQVTRKTSCEVLPALQDLQIEVSHSRTLTPESVSLVGSFVRERKLHGHPISSVHFMGLNR